MLDVTPCRLSRTIAKSMAKKHRPTSTRHENRSQELMENVFEKIWSRRKFDIIGRRTKGDVKEKSVTKARSAAVDKVSRTIK